MDDFDPGRPDRQPDEQYDALASDPQPMDSPSPVADLTPETPLEETGVSTGQNVRSFLWELIQTVVLAAALFMIIDFATARIRVQSISMQPTLYERDFVLVNKLAYRYGDLQRGDVVVFDPPQVSTEPYIKRIIGLPGDIIRVVGGEVYVNDVLLKEGYISAPPAYNGVWSVPEDSVFVLGDNRNNSSDSHSWGMLPIKNIIGKALFVYWPTDHWKVLHQDTAAAAAP
jgi:signal peptidase I